MEEKPKTRREIIDPVNAFTKAQKPLIIDLKNALKGQIHEIAENIKAKYVKPRKPRTEEQKAASKAKRAATMKAKKETREFETQTEKPETVDMGAGMEPEMKKGETKEELISNIESGKISKYNDLAKIGSRYGVSTSKVKGVRPNIVELKERILKVLKK